MLFDTIQFIGGQILPVRHRLYAFLGAAHADEFFDMAIPRRDVVVTDGPSDAIAVTLRRGEIGWTPACTRPTPSQRLSANLITTYPGERLLLNVGMIRVLHEKMCGSGIVS